jgi:hypothetical protein
VLLAFVPELLRGGFHADIVRRFPS